MSFRPTISDDDLNKPIEEASNNLNPGARRESIEVLKRMLVDSALFLTESQKELIRETTTPQ